MGVISGEQKQLLFGMSCGRIEVDFFVPGEAEPGGSKSAFMRPGMKFPVVVDANPKAKKWKKIVAEEAVKHWSGEPLLGPLKVSMSFIRAWRKGDLRADGSVKDPGIWPTSRPDVLKLSRPVEDALTSIIWVDDAQIVSEDLLKAYGSTPGVRIVVFSI